MMKKKEEEEEEKEDNILFSFPQLIYFSINSSELIDIKRRVAIKNGRRKM
jgi:hypothetical protein